MPKIKNKSSERTDNELLIEISDKLDILVLIISLNGKTKDEQKKILKNYSGPLSKRELERVSGIDRHGF